MSTYDGLLMRDSLSDNGTVPSPGYPYHSPDVICHDQVTDPKTFFTGNYTSDPSQPLQLGSRTNRIYVRAKNLSTSTKSGYYISVYRANASLFLRPSIWKNNKLATQSGDTYVALDSVSAGQVVAADTPFLLDAVSSTNYCLIGIVSTQTNPSVPADFTSYEAYILWVRKNQNVCGRNLSLVRSYPNRSYSQLDGFSNPSDQAVPTLFKTTVTGDLPSGTTFGLTCAPLGLDTKWNIDNGKVQTASSMTPANFNGTVTTWATLSSGTWPPGASLETTVYVGVDAQSKAAEFAESSWEEFGGVQPDVLGLSSPKLVRIGTCGTSFVASDSDLDSRVRDCER